MKVTPNLRGTLHYPIIVPRKPLLILAVRKVKSTRQIELNADRFAATGARFPFRHGFHHTNCLRATAATNVTQDFGVGNRSIFFDDKSHIYCARNVSLYRFSRILYVGAKKLKKSIHSTGKFRLILHYYEYFFFDCCRR